MQAYSTTTPNPRWTASHARGDGTFGIGSGTVTGLTGDLDHWALMEPMHEATRRAVDACLVGLNTEYTDEEKQRLSTPPYPLPERLVPHRDVVLAEVERLRREGDTDATCMSTLVQTHPQDWRAVADRLPDQHGDRFFHSGLMLIFTARDMSPGELEEVIPQVPDGIVRNHLRAQLIHVLLDRGDVEGAESASQALEPFQGDDQRFYGHRMVARWHAEQGDAAGFLARWPRLAASKDRQNMAFQKETLVESVARVHGWREALKVAADKRIGPRFRSWAFRPLADAGEVDQLWDLLSLPDGPAMLNEVDQLGVLTRALVARAKATGVATRHPFVEILDRIIALDPSDRSVMRTRDAMLLSLWPAYPDDETLALARRSARTPRIKRELTTLHPEVARVG